MKVCIALEEEQWYNLLAPFFTLEVTSPGKDVFTCVLKVHVIAIVCVLQFVGHHTESHDLLPDESVRPGDVHVHLRVVDLVGQPIIHNFRQVSAGHRGREQMRGRQEGPWNQIPPCCF